LRSGNTGFATEDYLIKYKSKPALDIAEVFRRIAERKKEVIAWQIKKYLRKMVQCAKKITRA